MDGPQAPAGSRGEFSLFLVCPGKQKRENYQVADKSEFRNESYRNGNRCGKGHRHRDCGFGRSLGNFKGLEGGGRVRMSGRRGRVIGGRRPTENGGLTGVLERQSPRLWTATVFTRPGPGPLSLNVVTLAGNYRDSGRLPENYCRTCCFSRQTDDNKAGDSERHRDPDKSLKSVEI